MPEIEPKPEIPEELNQKVSAIKALVSMHDLISRGTFEGFLAERVFKSQQFITSLHEQMMSEVKEHELGYLLEELTNPKGKDDDDRASTKKDKKNKK